ncbi:MAG: tRNA (adenosine(37)-N6)-threonylcarbamoyltransferase complex ATPase subunit type 1 TsaE [Pseudomonadota bacterium]
MSLVLRLCPTVKQTEVLGAHLGHQLRAGDCVTFTGVLGAGKTTLVRSLIRARAGAVIDVPSPTFALVETYEFETPIFHVDLYRLENPAEVLELGLDDMMGDGITLIEWPDRADDLLPFERLDVTISEAGEGREIVMRPKGEEWTKRLERWESA